MAHPTHQLEPACSVIRKLGGAIVIAKRFKKDRTTIFKWQMPKTSGGRGGNIPHWYHGELLKMAHDLGIELTPGELVQLPSMNADLIPATDAA